MPVPLTTWLEILPGLHREPIGSRAHKEWVGQIDGKIRGSSAVGTVQECGNQRSGKVTRGIGIDVNIERRCGTASLGIFTHHAHASDEGVDIKGRSGQDEVVSRLIVERGHRQLELLRADVYRRFRCWVVILIPEDEAGWKFRRCQNAYVSLVGARSNRRLHCAPKHALPFSTSLSERKRDQRNGQE